MQSTRRCGESQGYTWDAAPPVTRWSRPRSPMRLTSSSFERVAFAAKTACTFSRSAQRQGRVSEVRMVHEIERLETELQVTLLREVEILQRGEVPRVDP